MEQAVFAQLLRNFQTQIAASPIVDLQANAGDPTAPIVVLVHGIGGNARHWSDPTGVNIQETWLFDTGTQPPYQPNKLLVSPPYQANAVRNWCQFLSANNISWVNFSQARSQDALQYAVAELVTVLNGLENIVYASFAQSGEQPPPLVLLCHSRGGLVARAATKQLGSAGLPHLTKLLTLSTPHHGSYMPKLSNDYNSIVAGKVKFSLLTVGLPLPIAILLNNVLGGYISGLETIIAKALQSTLGMQASGEGFDELIPGSSLLQNLTQNEQPLPGVKYYSFGGSQPNFMTVFLGVVGQTIRLLDVAGLFLLGELAEIPEVQTLYGGLGELDKGDSAVALVSSPWPTVFAANHQNLPYNHMQALIYQPLQNTVLQLIKA